MSLIAGTNVVVADDETATGTGLRRELYDADKALLEAAGTLPTLPSVGSASSPFSAARPANATDVANLRKSRVQVLRDAARRANAYGGAIVAHFAANALVTVTIGTSTSGLQRTPDPNTVNTDTLGPSATKALNGTIT